MGRRHLLLKVHLFGPPSPVPTAWPLVVLGDDGLLKSLREIDAAIHLGLPMLIVVMNDAAYRALRFIISVPSAYSSNLPALRVAPSPRSRS